MKILKPSTQYKKAQAERIVRRLHESVKSDLKEQVLPVQPKDYTQEQTRAFALALSFLLNRFNIHTSDGINREWEVGGHSGYDDPDNRLSGTRMTI